MENRIELPQVVWGAHYAGLYYTLLSTRLTPAEAAYIIEDSGARVAVLSDVVAGRLLPGLTELLGRGLKPMPVGELLTRAAREESGPIPGAVEGTDMLYSSGTTGRPKRIVRPFTGKPLGSTALIAMLGELMVARETEHAT
jgi:fatty-acyl-CoA synthase